MIIPGLADGAVKPADRSAFSTARSLPHLPSRGLFDVLALLRCRNVHIGLEKNMVALAGTSLRAINSKASLRTRSQRRVLIKSSG